MINISGTPKYTSGAYMSGHTVLVQSLIIVNNNPSETYYNIRAFLSGILDDGSLTEGTSWEGWTVSKLESGLGTAFAPMQYGTGGIALPSPPNGRGMQMAIRIYYEDSNGNPYVTSYPLELWTVDRVYKPVIETFAAVRYSTDYGTVADDGTRALVDADISINIADENLPSGFTLQVTCTPNGDETKNVVIDLSSRFRDLINGVTNSLDLITDEYELSSSWSFTLYFGDKYENVSTTTTLLALKKEIPFHISGAKKGGVSIGALSTSTDDEPKFECHHPAYFYGGINIVDGGVYELSIGLDADAPFHVNGDNPVNVPCVRRFGHVVEIRGVVTPSSTITGGTAAHPIFTLPYDCAPANTIEVLQQGSTQSVWMLRIFSRDDPDSPCRVMFTRYRKGASWADAGTSTWLPFHATWIV